MFNKFQLFKILKIFIKYIPQTIKFLYVIYSMYFILRLIELEFDERLQIIEVIHLLIGGLFTMNNIKNLPVNDIKKLINNIDEK